MLAYAVMKGQGARRHPRYEEVASILRRRLEELRARDRASGPPGTALRPRPADVVQDDTEVLLRAKRRWVDRFKGRDPVDALGGDFALGRADVAEVHREFEVLLEVEHPGGVLQGALWLLHGVRDKLSSRLASAGYSTLRDLSGDERFGREAGRILEKVDSGDLPFLLEHIAQRGGAGHPLRLCLVGFLAPQDLLVLDIETMGLFMGSPVSVVGLGSWEDHRRLRVRQYVALHPDGEETMLEAVSREICSRAAVVTYNGRAFDLRYLTQRLAYYGVMPFEQPAHFDLLPFARRLFKRSVSDCKLETISVQVLGTKPKDYIPGHVMPAFYQEFLGDPTGNAGLLVAIVEHNREDVVNTARLLAHLSRRMGRGEMHS